MLTLNMKAVSPRAGKDFPLPGYATPGSAGIDLRACLEEPVTIPAGGRSLIPTGLAFALPSEGYVGLIFARSGLGAKHGVALANGVGVLDSDYRGEVMVALQNSGDAPYTVCPGDRIAQMVLLPAARIDRLALAEELDGTERGEGGFGSTGR